ncbi:hypothetical protein VPLG_00112 [Vibrio phage eugene 12A10]|uniref:hypothetical protein n=1 Tax=Vibrio phage eugene 12A10 TaxID=573172 RepID=UPI00035195F7|nr:hypothetical protein VPLG_00112 [Vibrio phage eugene 12A10]AGN51551.1 hypothetical protein VPLG_00112 [Vibrio phage eugene 12A10]
MENRRLQANQVVGKSFTARNGSVITVKEQIEGSGLSKFLCECSLCSEDCEIFPESIMVIDIRDFRNKKSPCRCSGKYEMSKWQIERLWERLIDSNFKVLNYFKEPKRNRSCISYLNKVTGSEGIIRSDRFLSGVYGNELKSKIKIREVNNQLLETGHFPEGSRFTPNYIKGGSYWIYHCANCSKDKFSEVGLCKGQFSSRLDALKGGRLPCRCGERPKLTSDQKLLVVKDEIHRRGAELLEVNLSGSQNSIKVPFICKNGHENSMRYDAFIRGNCCLKCSGIDNPYSYYPHRKDETDNLYIFKSTQGEDLIKIGRTFNISTRVNHFPKDYEFELLGTFQGRHEDIYKLEQKLLKKLKRFNYEPSVDFKGKSECFTPEILDHPEIISIFNLKEPTNDQ